MVSRKRRRIDEPGTLPNSTHLILLVSDDKPNSPYQIIAARGGRGPSLIVPSLWPYFSHRHPRGEAFSQLATWYHLNTLSMFTTPWVGEENKPEGADFGLA
jgi:hypothetical protein